MSEEPLFLGTDGTPLARPEDVIPFLGKGQAHWKVGRSAYEAAQSWFGAGGIPHSIREVLQTDPYLASAKPERIVFERKTRLDGLGRESQTDVLAFLVNDTYPVILGVEAKVDESFGPLVREWNDYTPGKLRRLAGLIERLGIEKAQEGLRYQLFHRVAAVLIEAEAARSTQAALIVQSFDPAHTGFSDFAAFSSAFGAPVARPGQLSRSRNVGGISIRLGWATTPLFAAGG